MIPNGVDDERFRPIGEREKERVREELGISGDLILYVSRMSFRKGPHVLLNAFQNIVRERDDAVLVMVGSGEMLPFLKAQAKFLGIEDRVRFLGYVSDDLLSKLYASADVFVLPSIMAEAFGIVVLEAMASGVPVVTTTVGGIPEVVGESGSGVLVPPGDELALVEAVSKLLSDKELARNLGEAGRKAVERRYSWKVIASEIEKVYEEVLRGL